MRTEIIKTETEYATELLRRIATGLEANIDFIGNKKIEYYDILPMKKAELNRLRLELGKSLLKISRGMGW